MNSIELSHDRRELQEQRHHEARNVPSQTHNDKKYIAEHSLNFHCQLLLALEKTMAMTTGSNNGISAEMNVTPMIDILLVLLVIFMMIVPLEHGEMAEIPQPSNSALPQPREDENVVIQVAMNGTEPDVKINKAAVPWNKLGSKLAEIFLKRGNRTAFVKGDRLIDFQYVADVIDTAHHAGVQRIGLLDPDHAL